MFSLRIDMKIILLSIWATLLILSTAHAEFFRAGEHHFYEPIVSYGDVEYSGEIGTKLIFHDSDGFIVNLDDGETVAFRNLVIKTVGMGYTGIEINATDASHFYSVGPIIENVCLTGADVNSDYWGIGVSLHNAWWSTLSNVTIYGQVDILDDLHPNEWGLSRGFALSGNSVGVTLTNCKAFFVGWAVDVTDGSEGLTVSKCHFVGVGTGIYWHTPEGEPLLNVNQSHIQSRLFGIYAVNLLQANISNNLFYSEKGLYDTVGVWLKGGDHHLIKDNTFAALYTGSYAIGIVIQDVNNYIIAPNIFHESMDF